MKAHLKSKTGRLMIEIDAGNMKELVERIAEAQEIIDADQQCGKCKSANIRFRVRTVEKFRFYELHCDDCNAVLSFGQKQDMVSLFPKRRGEDGEALIDRGWSLYLPKGDPR